MYSSLNNIVDLVEGGSTTRPPETVILDEVSEDVSDDDAPSADEKSWFGR